MKLSLGVPGDLKSLELILDNIPESPYEIYFSALNRLFGSLRFGTPESDSDELKEMFALLQQKGIKSNIVLNTTCFGNQQFSGEFLRGLDSYLNYLLESGVDTITLADPFLIKYVSRRFSDIKVVVSSASEVRTLNCIEYYNGLGVERIIISPDVNRELETIASFVNNSNAKIEILVNEGCLLYCPYKQAHHRFNSHKTRNGSEFTEENMRYIDICGAICLKDPSQITRSPFVRPEDVSLYEAIGVEHFKIAGRNLSPEWIIRAAKAYQERRYDGNIVELLNSKEFLKDKINIPNKYLKVI